MAPPKPTQTASSANRRGKVLSGPSSQTPSVKATPSSQTAQTRVKFVGQKPAPSPPSLQSSSHTRGKFLGKKPEASPSSVQGAGTSGSKGGDAENNSLDNLRLRVHNSKVAAASRRKAIAGQRQSVLDDLDEAENIVLSLLECASETASALSEMTTAKSRKSHGEKKDDEGGNAEQSFEELTANVRSNGVGYLAGVKKLHKLLSPHSSLVKSYKNHGGETSAETTSQSSAGLAAALPGASGAAINKIVEEATSNMYAVRVKKRLAMERSELMKEMIQLEELDVTGEDEGKDCGGANNEDSAGSKRKLESIEQQAG